MKQKICKGNYRVDKYKGCEKPKHIFRYGLCQKCFIKWTQTTEAGGEYIRKITIPQAKKQVKIDGKKRTQQENLDLLTANQYRAKYLQYYINEIAKMIDKGQMCICNPNVIPSDAGHFLSVKSSGHIACNLHNIHFQSRNSNGFKGGEDLKYYRGLISRYGLRYADYCEALRQSKVRQTKLGYIEALGKAKEFRLILKKKDLVYTAQHRIELRNQANEFIGLYEIEFTKFNV
jgi:hypothetical protein